MDEIELANLLDPLIREDCAEHLRRERAGASASMNGALDYTALKVARRAIEWLGSRQPLAEQPETLSNPQSS